MYSDFANPLIINEPYPCTARIGESGAAWPRSGPHLSFGASSLRQLGRSPIKGDHLWWAGFVGELVLHAVGLHPFILYAAAVAFWQLGNWTAFTE